MKKLIAFLCCLFCCIAYLDAQHISVTGRVVDSQKQPVHYAEVYITDGSDEVISYSLTDEKGKFSFLIEPSNCTLQIRYLGKIYYKKPCEFVSGTDLGDIEIDNILNIEAITVVGTAKLIEHRSDRLIYNVGSSPMASGFNVKEVLEQTPRLVVSDSYIGIIGKSTVGVMINERPVQMSGQQLIQYLQSMRSEEIDRIEIITSPPAKYSASGNSGLINIVSKTRRKKGWYGTMNGDYTQRTYGAYGMGAMISYNTDKFFLDLRANYMDESKKYDSKGEVRGDYFFWSSDRSRRDDFDNFNISLNTGLKISPKSDINFLYSYNDSNFDYHTLKDHTSYYTNNLLDSLTVQNNMNSMGYGIHSASLNYKYVSDNSLELVTNATFLYKDNNEDNVISSTNFRDLERSDKLSEYMYHNFANSSYNAFSLSPDLLIPVGFGEITAGARLSHINNRLETIYSDRQGGISTGRDSEYKYNELVLAAYVGTYAQLSDRWDLEAGLRYEYSSTDGMSSGSDRHSYSYHDLFPSVALNFVPNSDNSFSISYSKRIDRPVFSYVNPARIYTGTNTYVQGNPGITPVYSHNGEFSYIYKGKLYATIFYSNIRDEIEEIEVISPTDGEIGYLATNYYDVQSLGAFISYNYSPLEWWSLYANLSYSYNNSRSINRESLKGNYTSFSIYNNFFITPEKKYAISVSYIHSFRGVSGITTVYPRASLNIGVSGRFFNNKFTVRLNVTDVFNQYISTNLTRYNDFSTYNELRNDTRSVRLSLTYNFGTKPSRTFNSGVNDENSSRL